MCALKETLWKITLLFYGVVWIDKDEGIFLTEKGEKIIETSQRKGSYQFVFDGIAGSGTARGDTDFAVDSGQVPVDGATTDDQLLSHLGIGQALGHQAQHLHLTCR